MEDNRVTNVLRIVETRKEREETLTISVRICIVKCTISWHPRVFNLFRYIPIVAQDLVSCSTSDTCTDKNVKKIRKETSKYLIRTHVQGNFLVSYVCPKTTRAEPSKLTSMNMNSALVAVGREA